MAEKKVLTNLNFKGNSIKEVQAIGVNDIYPSNGQEGNLERYKLINCTIHSRPPLVFTTGTPTIASTWNETVVLGDSVTVVRLPVEPEDGQTIVFLNMSGTTKPVSSTTYAIARPGSSGSIGQSYSVPAARNTVFVFSGEQQLWFAA